MDIQEQVLDMVGKRVAHVAIREHPVGPFAGQLDQRVVGVIEVVVVVADAANHRVGVGGREGEKPVVAVIAIELVVAGVSSDGVVLVVAAALEVG